MALEFIMFTYMICPSSRCQEGNAGLLSSIKFSIVTVLPALFSTDAADWAFDSSNEVEKIRIDKTSVAKKVDEKKLSLFLTFFEKKVNNWSANRNYNSFFKPLPENH